MWHNRWRIKFVYIVVVISFSLEAVASNNNKQANQAIYNTTSF
jgi:hypothetical protein